jgi:hypothetical protein
MFEEDRAAKWSARTEVLHRDAVRLDYIDLPESRERSRTEPHNKHADHTEWNKPSEKKQARSPRWMRERFHGSRNSHERKEHSGEESDRGVKAVAPAEPWRTDDAPAGIAEEVE